MKLKHLHYLKTRIGRNGMYALAYYNLAGMKFGLDWPLASEFGNSGVYTWYDRGYTMKRSENHWENPYET